MRCVTNTRTTVCHCRFVSAHSTHNRSSKPGSEGTLQPAPLPEQNHGVGKPAPCADTQVQSAYRQLQVPISSCTACLIKQCGPTQMVLHVSTERATRRCRTAPHTCLPPRHTLPASCSTPTLCTELVCSTGTTATCPRTPLPVPRLCPQLHPTYASALKIEPAGKQSSPSQGVPH